MNYYFSGSEAVRGENRDRIIEACPHRLLSCHGAYVKIAREWVRDTGQQTEIMLDSGAFTAWSKGEEVLLGDLIEVYAEFIENHEHHVKAIWLINLDKIPGSPGRTAGAEELDEAIKISDDNFEVLQKQFGARVLPVFHQNEPLARLREVESMSDYICVSPRNDLPEGNRVEWSAEVHGLLGANTRTHGLATTGAAMMSRVPWFSVDSATWVIAGGLGGVLVLINGKLRSISISQESPAKKDINKHYDTMSVNEQQVVEHRIKRLGFTVEDARVNHEVRKVVNMLETIEFVETQQPVNSHYQEGLFDL